MSRPLRIVYPEAWYHIMNRGRRSEAIFSGKEDFQMFIALLEETAEIHEEALRRLSQDSPKMVLWDVVQQISEPFMEVSMKIVGCSRVQPGILKILGRPSGFPRMGAASIPFSIIKSETRNPKQIPIPNSQ